MKIERLLVGELGTNAYFLENEDTRELLVVDPGGNGRELAQRINDKGFTALGILLTHGHYDHTDGIEELNKNLTSPVKVYALDKEAELLENPAFNLSGSFGFNGKSYIANEFFRDGEEVEIGSFKFKVIATPGHTKGSCCFYFPEDGILISGDTLFDRSVGRTDFPGGSMTELVNSIKEKLFTLPDDTEVLPGHMGITTIGDEKAGNMFVR